MPAARRARGGHVHFLEWDSRAAAEAFYDQDWTERMLDVYQVVPDIGLFDLHAVVDNEAQSSADTSTSPAL